MKTNEARVLIFLKSAGTEVKYASYIASKLEISYNYLLQTLKTMLIKGWVTQYKRHNRVYYQLTVIAPIDEAVSLHSGLPIEEIREDRLNQMEEKIK